MGLLVPACFVVSGATSLILQVVWVRKLVEVFGSSTLAIATVLAAFMGGLALGAAIGGRLADRFGNGSGRGRDDPFLYYGVAEAIVGLSALAIPALIAGFSGPNAWLWSHLGDAPWLLSVARSALTFAVLLVPTTAMGATLPLLTRRVTARAGGIDRLGRHLGVLYAANTIGAVIGAGMAGFVLIPAIGALASGRVAAFGALGLAAVVALAVTRRGARAQWLAAPPTIAASPSEQPERPGRRLALAAYALSGAVAMGLEVLFSRALAVVNGSSVTSFTLVLVVFLAGISLGAAIIANLADRTKNPIRTLGVLLVLASIAIAFAALIIDELPAISAALLSGARLEASAIIAVHATVTAIVIAPVAICLGAIMPVAIRAYVGSRERVGRDVGRAYAANTIGAIVGSVATGFFLMPALTIEGTLRLLIVLDGAMGAALLFASTSRVRTRIIAAGIGLAALVAALMTPAWNKSDFTAGLFRTHVARAAIRSGIYDRDVVFYRDGTASTVSVEALSDGVVVLKNNGKVEASTKVDMPTQILVGLLPVLLHQGADIDVFVVGYGSGVTVGAIAADPAVARVDVAEIEPAVYEAADAHFSSINRRPQDDPRVTRLVGDGRNILLAGKRRYDLIVSEPSNPWIAGVASLFTREFYAFARRHLKDDGIFCQWAQLYELGPGSVKMIYRTFAEAFPYVTAFTPGDQVTDTILIGSMQPLDLSPSRIDALIAASPTIASELHRADIADGARLIAAAFLLPGEIASFVAGADVNTDDSGALEYRAPRDLLDSATRGSFARMTRSLGWPYGRLDELIGPSLDDAALARALLEYGRRSPAARFLARAAPSAAAAEVELLTRLSRAREFADPELPPTAHGPPLPEISASLFDATLDRAGPAADALRASFPFVADGQWVAAYRELSDLPPRANSDAGRDITLFYGYLAFKAVEHKRATEILAPLATHPGILARRPAVLYYYGRSQYGYGSFRAGIATLEAFAKRFPAIAEEAARDPWADAAPTDDKLGP